MSYEIGSLLLDLNVDISEVRRASDQSSRIVQTAVGTGLGNATSSFFNSFNQKGATAAKGLGLSVKAGLTGAVAGVGLALGAVATEFTSRMMSFRNAIGKGLVSTVGQSIIDGINQAATTNQSAIVTDVILRNNDAASSTGDLEADTNRRVSRFNQELTAISSQLSFSRTEVAKLIEDLARVGFTEDELFGTDGMRSVSEQFAVLGKALGLAGNEFSDLVNTVEIVRSSFGADMENISATLLTLANSTSDSLKSLRFGITRFASTALASGVEMNSAFDLFSRLVKTASPRIAGTVTKDLLTVTNTIDAEAYLKDILPSQEDLGLGNFLTDALDGDSIAEQIFNIYDSLDDAIKEGRAEFTRGMSETAAALRFEALSDFQKKNVKLDEISRITGQDRANLAILFQSRENQQNAGGQSFIERQRESLVNDENRGLEAFKTVYQQGIGGLIDVISSNIDNLKENLVSELLPGVSTIGQVILETVNQISLAENIFANSLGKVSTSLTEAFGGTENQRRIDLVNRLSTGFINIIQTTGEELAGVANNFLNIINDPAQLREIFSEAQTMISQAVESWQTMNEFMFKFNNTAKFVTNTINSLVEFLGFLGDSFSFIFRELGKGFQDLMEDIYNLPIIGGAIEGTADGLGAIAKGQGAVLGEVLDYENAKQIVEADKEARRREQNANLPTATTSEAAQSAIDQAAENRAKQRESNNNFTPTEQERNATPLSARAILDVQEKIAEQRRKLENDLLAISQERLGIEDDIMLMAVQNNELLSSSLGEISSIFRDLDEYRVTSEEEIERIRDAYTEPIEQLEANLLQLEGRLTDNNPELLAKIEEARQELVATKEAQSQAINQQTAALEAQNNLTADRLASVLSSVTAELSASLSASLGSFVNVGTDTSGFTASANALVAELNQLRQASEAQTVLFEKFNDGQGTITDAQVQAANQTKQLVEELAKNRIRQTFNDLVNKVENFGDRIITDLQQKAFGTITNFFGGDTASTLNQLSNAVFSFKETTLALDDKQKMLVQEFENLNAALDIRNSQLKATTPGSDEFTRINNEIRAIQAQRLAALTSLRIQNEVSNSAQDVNTISLAGTFTKTLDELNSKSENLIQSLTGVDNSAVDFTRSLRSEMQQAKNLADSIADVKSLFDFADRGLEEGDENTAFEKMVNSYTDRIETLVGIRDNQENSSEDREAANEEIKRIQGIVATYQEIGSNLKIFDTFAETLIANTTRLGELKIEEFANSFRDASAALQQARKELMQSANQSDGSLRQQQIESRNFGSYRRDIESSQIEFQLQTDALRNALEASNAEYDRKIRDAEIAIERFELSIPSSVGEKGDTARGIENEVQATQLSQLKQTKNILENEKREYSRQLQNEIDVQEQLFESYISMVGRVSRELAQIASSTFDGLYDALTSDNVGKGITDLLNSAMKEAGRVGFEMFFGGARDWLVDLFLPKDVSLRNQEFRDLDSSQISDDFLTTKIDGTNEATQVQLERLIREVMTSTTTLDASFQTYVDTLRTQVSGIGDNVAQNFTEEKSIMSEVAANTNRTATAIEEFLGRVTGIKNEASSTVTNLRASNDDSQAQNTATDLKPIERNLLDAIAYSEGTANRPNNGYNTLYGGGQFEGYATHPNIRVTAGGYTSSAAGRYQIMDFHRDNMMAKYGDFSPESQDRFALDLARQTPGVSEALDSGDLLGALEKLTYVWEGLGKNQGQQPGGKSFEDIMKWLESRPGKAVTAPGADYYLNQIPEGYNPEDDEVYRQRARDAYDSSNLPSQGVEVASTDLSNLGLGSESLVQKHIEATDKNTYMLDRFSQQLLEDANTLASTMGIDDDTKGSSTAPMSENIDKLTKYVTEDDGKPDTVTGSGVDISDKKSPKTFTASMGKQVSEDIKKAEELAKKQKLQEIGSTVGAGFTLAQQAGILNKPQTPLAQGASMAGGLMLQSSNPYLMAAGGLLMLGSSIFGGGSNKPKRYNTGIASVGSPGLVGGAGTRDTVPALLTPGESVLNIKATQMLGTDAINRLNSGSLNEFNHFGKFNTGVASISRPASLGMDNIKRGTAASSIPNIAREYSEYVQKTEAGKDIEDFQNRFADDKAEEMGDFNINLTTTSMGGKEWVDVETFRSGMEATLARAQQSVYKGIRGSTRTRKQLGL